MKKIIAALGCAVLLAAAVGCGKSGKAEYDLSGLTGAEVISDDGSVSILLPDPTFSLTQKSGTAMDFESSTGEGYISVVKADEFEEEPIYDMIPKTKEEVLKLFGDVNGETEITDFSYSEKDGVKYYTSVIAVTGFKEDEDSEEEDFWVLENLVSTKDEYYYATAEIYNENVVDNVAASLSTFGDVD